MLTFFAWLVFAVMLTVLLSAAVGLFYVAISASSVTDFIYGAALDLFSCMLIFGSDSQRVESAYISSLVAVTIIAFTVYVYRKIKTPKKVQN